MWLQSRRGPDLSCTADRGDRAALAPQRLPFFSLLIPLCLSYCTVSSFPPPSHHISLFPFWLLPAVSSFSSPPLLSPYISISYPPSVIRCLPLSPPPPFSHSFSLPQSNSRSFIGIIRWILLSLWLSFWRICLPLTNSPLLMLLHKTLLHPVQASEVMVSVQCVQYALSHKYWSQGHVFFITLLMNKQAKPDVLILGSFTSTVEARVSGFYRTTSLKKCLKSSLTVLGGLESDFYVYSDTMWKCLVTVRAANAAGNTSEMHFMLFLSPN